MISSLIKSINRLASFYYDDFNTTKIDNMIVGGGIVGSSLAYHMSFFNKSIILIDKYNIGSGSTCLSAGTIYSSYYKLPSIENINSNDFIKSYLSIGTIDIIKSIDKKMSCDFNQIGSITLSSKRTIDYLNNKLNKGREKGQILEMNNLGLCAPYSAYVDPCKTVHVFSELSKKNGVKILDNTFIEKLQYKDGNYIIKLNNSKKYICKNLILTNGIGINQVTHMLGINVPIIPVKGIIWNIQVESNDIIKNIIYSSNSAYTWNKYPTLDLINSIPNNCTHYTNGNVINHNYININRFIESIFYKNDLEYEHFYGKPYTDENGKLNIMFGFNRQVALNENDYDIEEKEVKKFFNKIKGIFPLIKNDKPDNYWSGLMPFSIYNTPIVGNFECFNHKNLWIANGFGADGIALGPMTTKLLSDIILDKDSKDAKKILENYNVVANSCKKINYTS